MDDYHFQQQLHSLKERVSELSSNRSPALGQFDDPFMNQLHDLKTHLASMQDRCEKFQGEMRPEESAMEAFQRPANSSSLAYAPFNDLSAQVYYLKERVGAVERTCEDLEDKMDGMDPNRFTPAESTSEFEDPFSRNNSNDADRAPYSFVPELSSDSSSQPPQPSQVGWMCTQPYEAFGFYRPQMKPTDPEKLPYKYFFPGDDDTRFNMAPAGSMNKDVQNHATILPPPARNDPGSVTGVFGPNSSVGQEYQRSPSQPDPINAILQEQARKQEFIARQVQDHSSQGWPPFQPDSVQSTLLREQARKNQLMRRQEQGYESQRPKQLSAHSQYHENLQLLQLQAEKSALMRRQDQDISQVPTQHSMQSNFVDQNTQTDSVKVLKHYGDQYLPENPASGPWAPFETKYDKKRALMRANDAWPFYESFEQPPRSGQPAFVNDAEKPPIDNAGSKYATGENWSRFRPQSPKRNVFKTDDDQHEQVETRPSGGVAFRDREIGRMDEQLRIAHERLRDNEEILSQKEAQIARLQEHARSIEQTARKNITDLQAQLEAQETEIREMYGRIERSDDDLREYEKGWRSFQELYQRTKEKEKAYREAHRQQRLHQYTLVNKLTRTHEGEIKRFQTFCQEKDALVYRQDKIMGEKIQLLEQRDQEIERLQREVRAAEDDKEDAVRNASRMVRLLDEKNEEISQLKERLPTENTGHRNSLALDEETQSSNLNSVEVEHSEPAAPGYNTVKVQRYEYPIREPLGNEQRWLRSSSSPYLWETAIPEYGQPESVDPGPYRYTSVGKRGVRGSRRQKAHRDELGEFWRPPSPSYEENGASFGPVERSTDPLGARHHDATLRPPLPAPPLGTARRMASEADLRVASRNDRANLGQNRLAKHQSMLELRRNRLQAYVETDPESSGEFGGEV